MNTSKPRKAGKPAPLTLEHQQPQKLVLPTAQWALLSPEIHEYQQHQSMRQDSELLAGADAR